MKCVFKAALAVLVATAGAQAKDNKPVSPLCLVPVKNGQPTAEDLFQTWRMVERAQILPGIARPILYALNRKGVWTIDENNAFVPFGGAFPANWVHDKFVTDPVTGRSLGWGWQDRAFKIERGQTQFTEYGGTIDNPVGRIQDAIYVARMQGIVVAEAENRYLPDGKDLYLLDHALRRTPLPVSGPKSYVRAGRLFDLPEMRGLLIETKLVEVDGAEQDHSSVMLRFDSGETIRVATLEKWDSVVATKVADNGDILVTTHWSQFPIKPPQPDASGKYAEPLDAGFVRDRAKFPRPSTEHQVLKTGAGRAYVWNRRGVWERTGGRDDSVLIPFQFGPPEIDWVMDDPKRDLLVVLTDFGIFTVFRDGRVVKTPESERAVGALYQAKGPIPGRDAILIVGGPALFLLVDAKGPDAKSCLQPERSPIAAPEPSPSRSTD